MEFENQIEPIIQETNNITELQNTIEAHREETKKKLSLNDEEFDQLVKDFIIDCFAKLHIKISADDPIFAVILSQKNVMEYYSSLITQSLHAIPRQIGDTIDEKLQEKLELLQNGISQAMVTLDEAASQIQSTFSKSSLDLNNQIVTSLDAFSKKKAEEIKETFENIKPPKVQVEKQVFRQAKSPLLWIITGLTALNIAISGISLTGLKFKEENKESAYQIGLYKGFEEMKKVSPKEAEKMQKIIIESIDNELRKK